MLSKDEIVKALQDLTTENAGNTPSEEKFYDNTEVKITDRRKYWTNYGELVVEAGLTPNKFDKTKFSHNELCEIFIKAIRENGRWPTRGVLDVKHHNNADFPDSSTFYKKLGLTGELARTILKFINNKPEFEDISQICNDVVEKYKDKPALENTIATKGCVYLIKQLRQYKIGETDDVDRRLFELTKGPERPELIHAIETDDRKGVERYWHKRFETKRGRGEWFKLDTADVRAFRRTKNIG